MANESTFTPEQELALETQRAETARLRAERAKFEAEAIELEAKNRSILAGRKQADTVAEAFKASGVKFHNVAAVKKLLEAGGHPITIDDDGKAVIQYDGEILDASEALRRVAVDNAYLADGRSLRHVETTRPKVPTSKADLSTVELKTAFIAEHGIEKFEQLPGRIVQQSEPKHFGEWVGLPLSEKSKLLKADPDYLRKLPRYAPEVQQQRLTGIRVNRTGKGYQTA